MSRSSPSAPGYLQAAIYRVEDLLRDCYPEPLTAREIADRLAAEGFRWPLPQGYYRAGHHTAYRQHNEGDPTPERVRRVCKLKHNRTVIGHAGTKGRADAWTIYSWALDGGRWARREAGDASA